MTTYNLKLHLPKPKEKITCRVVPMIVENNKGQFSLNIGNCTHFKQLLPDIKSVYVNDVLLAAAFLKERLREEVVPHYIMCNLDEHPGGLEQLLKVLESFSALHRVPVLVYSYKISDAGKERLRKIKRIDAILTHRTTDQEFLDMLNFVIKFRGLSIQQATAARKRRKPVPVRNAVNYLLKRIFDIALSSIALFILSPLFLLIAIRLKIESNGPVFYTSLRAGTRYRIFKFYKFRSMVPDADQKVTELARLNQYGNPANNGRGLIFFKLSNDPRVTPFGSFLRNTSLDELPQLVNVLLGHMSLVGNRPLPLYEAEALTTDDYAGRFLAPAGITGLWQIKKRGKKEMSVDERIFLDKDYAARHSFLYDLWILAHTPTAMVQKEKV